MYAILATPTGELLETRDFPTTSAGRNRAIAWVARRTGADLATLWVIEGAASYGALLAGSVGAAGYTVAEAARMDARTRHGIGKSDPLDAHRIAAGGRTKKEIRRSVKRYLARRIYRTLNATNPSSCCA